MGLDDEHNVKEQVRDTKSASSARIDHRLEALVIPVSNVDRAKQFYGNLGWRLDADFAFDNGFRVVQFTNWPAWYAEYMVSEQTGKDEFRSG